MLAGIRKRPVALLEAWKSRILQYSLAGRSAAGLAGNNLRGYKKPPVGFIGSLHWRLRIYLYIYIYIHIYAYVCIYDKETYTTSLAAQFTMSL